MIVENGTKEFFTHKSSLCEVYHILQDSAYQTVKLLTDLFTSNIGIVTKDSSETDIDEQRRRHEKLRIRLRYGFGEGIFLGLRQRNDILDFVKRHCESG